jgi:hypothetical protein
MLLSGCSKGLDRTPDYTSEETYRAIINQASSEATPAELEAFDYAVSNLTIEQLAVKYKGMSFRKLAKTELEFYITEKEKC